jgi:hypothetical protein
MQLSQLRQTAISANHLILKREIELGIYLAVISLVQQVQSAALIGPRKDYSQCSELCHGTPRAIEQAHGSIEALSLQQRDRYRSSLRRASERGLIGTNAC